mgnify:CR=1 FL=1
MKKNVLLFAICAMLFSSCGKSTENQTNPDDRNRIIEKCCNEIKSYGAKDAYVDDEEYFVYGVLSSEISASGDQVAKAMYPMVEEIPDLKGVKVVDVETKKELGRYSAQ